MHTKLKEEKTPRVPRHKGWFNYTVSTPFLRQVLPWQQCISHSYSWMMALRQQRMDKGVEIG